MFKRRLVVVSIIMTVLSSLQVSGAVAGLGDVTITGTVTDKAGTALAGVRVSDGYNSTWTGSNGSYSIDEPLGSEIVLTAYRTGLVPESRAVMAIPGKVVDFNVLYELSVSITPDAFNNSSPTTVSIRARTYAPSDSCVSWQDSSTGASIDLLRDGSAEGTEAAWTGEYVVDTSRSEGIFSSSASTEVCATSLSLTPSVSRSYIVDRTPPSLDRRTLFPLDHGNSIFQSQALSFRPVETLSGIDPAASSFRLGSGSAISASLDSAGRLKSGPLPLTWGQTYVVTATFADRAGNVGEDSWTFLATRPPEFASVSVTVDAAGTDTGQPGSTPGTTKWKFEPYVQLSDRKVTFPDGSFHPGFGTVASSVPVGSAEVRVTVAGQENTIPTLRPYSEGAVRTVYQQLVNLRPSSTTALVAGGSHPLEQITIDIPIGTEKARIYLEDVSQGSITAVCPDPVGQLVGCSTDPLRVFIPDDFAIRMSSSYDSTYLCPDGTGTCVDASPLVGLLRLVASMQWGGVWRSINPFAGASCDPYAGSSGDLMCWAGGVGYPVSSPVVLPVNLGNFCAEVTSCIYMSSSDRQVDKRNCISQAGNHWYGENPGDDKPPNCSFDGCYGAGSERCQQFFSIDTYGWQFQGEVSRRTINAFRTVWMSEWGAQDWNQDNLGVHWSNRGPNNSNRPSWTIAEANDVTVYADRAIKGEFGAWDNIYPRDFYTGTVDSAALDAYFECFDGNWNSSVRTHDRGSEGLAWGAGTDNGGYPQNGNRYCSQTGSSYWYRTDYAVITAFYYQSNFYGRAMDDGNLVGTWGHETEQLTFDGWDFVKSATSCAMAPPKCNYVGLIFSSVDWEKKADWKRKERSKAFSYR